MLFPLIFVIIYLEGGVDSDDRQIVSLSQEKQYKNFKIRRNN